MTRRALTAITTAAGALLAAAAASAQPARAAAAQPVIRMSGQQITEAVVADLAFFYRHAVRNAPRFELTPGGTAGGLADLARGITDAAMVSRNLEATDPAGLRLHRLAFSGVCLTTHDTNPVPGMSVSLVRDIVAGRVTSWAQVPGSKRTDAILPVALDPGTGASTVFGEVFLTPADPVAWRPVTLLLSIQARDYVEATPAAFGYMDLAATGPVHAVPYDGHACTRATVKDGSYPARRPLGIVTHGQPKPALRRFLRWIKTSHKAQQVLNRRYVAAVTGATPRGR